MMPSPRRETILWLLYSPDPGGVPPRRWKGLVGYGRLDIAARFMLASLYPGGVYNGDSLLVFLDRGSGGRCLVFTGDCLPEAMSYEHESAQLLLDTLRGKSCRVVEGCGTLRGLVLGLRRRGWRVALLHEAGERLEWRGGGLAFVVGSRVDPPVKGVGYDAVYSIGCRSYLASSVASYINLLRRIRAVERGDVG